jgi:hypothetical protein
VSAEQTALGAGIVQRLLGARIVVCGTNEEGEILLGALADDGVLTEIIIFVEDGELMLSETTPQRDTPL